MKGLVMGFFILEINRDTKGDIVINSRVKTSPRDQQHIVNLLNILKENVNAIVKKALIQKERGNNGTGL